MHWTDWVVIGGYSLIAAFVLFCGGLVLGLAHAAGKERPQQPVDELAERRTRREQTGQAARVGGVR